MNTTPNINLSTYTSDPNDKFNLLVTFNNNMSKIDTAIGAQNDAIDVIEQTANTAVSTANTASTTATGASTTATQALDVANSKPSINDTVAGATSTYSSNKIEELISGIEPGTEIDDTVTSTTKTWSSSKINTEINKTKLDGVLSIITLLADSTYTIPRLNNLNELVFTLVDNNRNVVSSVTITKENFVDVGYNVELREFVNNNMYTSKISFVEGTTIRIVNSSYLVSTANYHIFVYGR